MVELNDTSKRVVKSGKHFLEENDIEGFYDHITEELRQHYNVYDEDSLGCEDDIFDHISEITSWFLEKGINPLKYCKTKVPYNMFDGTNITEAIIPDSVKEIETYAFCGCRKLKKVILPKHLERIDMLAFNCCDSLNEIVIPKFVRVIGEEAFGSWGDPHITIYCESDPDYIRWPDKNRYHIERV